MSLFLYCFYFRKKTTITNKINNITKVSHLRVEGQIKFFLSYFSNIVYYSFQKSIKLFRIFS